jgi:hypothetical protein
MDNERFANYESPIERTLWVRKCAAKFTNSEVATWWEGCTVKMEQTRRPGGEVDFGTLSIFGNSKNSIWFIFPLPPSVLFC